MSKVREEDVLFRVQGISWVRDMDATLLVEEKNGRTFTLKGLEATIWDWLTLGFSHGKIVGLLATILNSPTDEAESRLDIILSLWIENGVVKIEENIAHD